MPLMKPFDAVVNKRSRRPLVAFPVTSISPGWFGCNAGSLRVSVLNTSCGSRRRLSEPTEAPGRVLGSDGDQGRSRCRPITTAMARIGTPSSAIASSGDPARDSQRQVEHVPASGHIEEPQHPYRIMSGSRRTADLSRCAAGRIRTIAGEPGRAVMAIPGRVFINTASGLLP